MVSNIISANEVEQEIMFFPLSVYLSVCFFFSITLTVGASRLMEAQMDLPHLLFGVGFRIFIMTP